jgi:hypothetical protein
MGAMVLLFVFTWSAQLQRGGRLTPGLPSFFTSRAFAHNEIWQNTYHVYEFYSFNVGI